MWARTVPRHQIWICCIATYYAYTYTYRNIYRNIIKHHIRTSMNEQTHFFIKIYLSHFILERVDVDCVWKMSWRRGQTVILTQSSSDHSSTPSSSWLGFLNRGSLRAQSPLSAAGSHFGILSSTDSNWLEPPRVPGYIIVLRPPASAVLPLIYTSASLDWRLGRGSICYASKLLILGERRG